MTGVVGQAPRVETEPAIDVKTLNAKIWGVAARERFFVRGAWQGWTIAERKTMIDRAAKLSVSRQANLLEISRGGIYYQYRPVSYADLKLMRRIDMLPTGFPFAGSLMLQGFLMQKGFAAVRWHAITLRKRMGIEVLYPKPNTVNGPVKVGQRAAQNVASLRAL